MSPFTITCNAVIGITEDTWAPTPRYHLRIQEFERGAVRVKLMEARGKAIRGLLR